jgi:hypothetical protein
MRRATRLAALAGASVALGALAFPTIAGADQSQDGGGDHHADGASGSVYVQTNDPTGNQIVTYERTEHGGLRLVGRTGTGGLGVALGGAVVDPLASQGSLAFDPDSHVLVGVNGGSNTFTEFRTFGPFVGDPRVVPSGGSIPVGVAVRGDEIYVLNAGGGGQVQGYYADSLRPIPGSAHPLGLNPSATPQFLNTPGQIGFTPGGRQLVVTTKANGSSIDVFSISASGALSDPTVNPSATPVPFGFTFDRQGHLVVTEAGTSALTTYSLHGNGTVSELGSVTDGLAALCWVANADNRFFYGSNAGSGVLSTYTIGVTGQPSLVATTATDAGPIDLAASTDGDSLYVETGGSDLIDTFAVSPTGKLTPTGAVAPELSGHTGLEGIAVG